MSSYPERLPACHCWENARLMVALHPELHYVEGYLVFPRPDGFEPFGWSTPGTRRLTA